MTARVVLFTDGRLTDFSNEDAKENEAEQHISQSVCLTLLYITQILHAFNVPNYLYLPWGDKGQGEAHILVLFPEKRYNLFTLISKKKFLKNACILFFKENTKDDSNSKCILLHESTL